MVARTLQTEGVSSDYHVAPASPDRPAHQVYNRAHDIAADFDADGVRISSSGWSWGLSLDGYGRGGRIQPVSQAKLTATDSRIEYSYPGVAEWYLNGPMGLQQGFTIESDPDPLGGGPLEVRLALSGDVIADVEPGGRAAVLRRMDGTAALAYRGLYAYDSGGKELAARLAETAGGLSILVEDGGAEYPITIDPFVQEARLYASDGQGGDLFGTSIAMDGDTVVVGTYLDDDDGRTSGSAYVFTKPSGGWVQTSTAAKLTAFDGAGGEGFGFSVAVDGDTIAVSAVWDDDKGGQSGSAYVFTRPSRGWVTTSTAVKLTAYDGAAEDLFGYSVAVDNDGDTIVVGAFRDDVGDEPDVKTDAGSAYVFTKPTGGWVTTSTATKLTAYDGVTEDLFGVEVAVEGDTIAVSAVWDDDSETNSGSVYLFTKPSGGWATTSSAAKLTAYDPGQDDLFGLSVAMDTSTVVVGAFRDDVGDEPDVKTDAGSAYVFTKPSGGWVTTSTAAKLTAYDRTGGDRFGTSVAIDSDGGTIVVGAPFADVDDRTDAGSAYVFTKPDGGWVTTSTAEKMLPTSFTGRGYQFGSAVAADGGRVVVGASRGRGIESHTGAAYVFKYVPPRADLEVVVHDRTAGVYAGGRATYNFGVYNDGPAAATDASLEVTLPSGVTLAEIGSEGGLSAKDCTGTTTLTCSFGTVDAGWGDGLWLGVGVGATTTDPMAITLSFTSAVTDPDTTNNTTTATTRVLQEGEQAVDLRVWIGGARTAAAGRDLTYQMWVRNDGPSDATGVTVTTTLPSNVTLSTTSTGQGTCSGTTTITCDLGAIDAHNGVNAWIDVTIDSNATGTLEMTASVTSTVEELDSSNNSASRSTEIVNASELRANLDVSVNVWDTAYAGGELTYQVRVFNGGPSEATGVTATTTLPSGVTLSATSTSRGTCTGTTTIACDLGRVPVSSDEWVRVTVSIATSTTGTLAFTAEASSDVVDPYLDNNSRTTTVPVVQPRADLEVVVHDRTAGVYAGGRATYNFGVYNDGPAAATDASLEVTLPSGVTLAEIGSEGDLSAKDCTGTTTLTCSFGTVDAGWGDGLWLGVGVGATTTDPMAITLSFTSAVTDPDTTNNTTTATTRVLQEGEQAVDLRVWIGGARTAAAGRDLTYQMWVRNDGPSDATGVTVTTTLPSNVTLSTTSTGQGTCSGTTTITCDLGAIDAHNGVNAWIDVTIDSNATGTLEMTASVTSTVEELDSSNNSASRSTEIVNASELRANLDVSVNVWDTAYAGGELTYQVRVFNGGPSEATGVTATTTLPSGVTLSATSTSRGTCTGTTTIACDLGRVPVSSDEWVRVTVSIATSTTGTLAFTAEASSDVVDPYLDNNSRTTTVPVVQPRADLEVVVHDRTAGVYAGGRATYNFGVYNDGPAAATDASLEVTLPSGVTLAEIGSEGDLSAKDCTGTTTLTCSFGTVDAGWGDGLWLGVGVGATTTDPMAITLSFTSAVTDPDTTNNTTTATTRVLQEGEQAVDLRVWIGGARTAAAGRDLTYQMWVRNDGPSDATGVTVTTTLPSNVTLSTTSTGQGTCSGTTTITCDLGAIDAHNGVNAWIDVTIDSNATGTLEMTASVTSTVEELDSSNNSASRSTEIVNASELRANLDVSVNVWDTAYAGGELTYQVRVFNGGPSEATGVTATTTLPSGVTLSATSTSRGTCTGTTTIACDLGRVPVSSDEWVRVTVSIATSTTGTLAFTAEASSDVVDPYLDNNSRTTTVPVVQPRADLEVVVHDRTAGVYAGGRATYNFGVYNDGPAAATDASLEVTLPSGVTLAEIGSEGDLSAKDCTGTTTLTCSFGTVDAGWGDGLWLGVGVGATTTDPMAITLSFTSAVTDPDTTNNTTTATTRVLQEGEQAVDLRVWIGGARTAAAGRDLTYQMWVRNDGPSDATGVTVTTTLPSNVTLSTTSTGQGTCSGTTTITCDLGAIDAHNGVNAWIDVTIDSNATGTLEMTASVTSTVEELDSSNNSASRSTEIVNASELRANLYTHINVWDTAYAGGEFTYQVRVFNGGPSEATGVTATTTLPAGVTLSATSTSRGTCTGTTTIACDLGRVPVSSDEWVRVTVSIATSTTGTLAFTAEASSDVVDPYLDNNSRTTTVPVVQPRADLEVVVHDRTAGVYVDTEAKYVFSVHNDGPDIARNTSLEIVLPLGVTLAWSYSCSSDSETGNITCDLDWVQPDSRHIVEVALAIGSDAPDRLDLTATVTSAAEDENSGNDSATATSFVLEEGEQAVDLWTSISGPLTAATSTEVSYRLFVWNNGPSDATGVTATTTLPSGVTLSSVSELCSGSSATVITCNLGTLTPGSGFYADIDVSITSTATGTLSFTATATSTVRELLPDNNTHETGTGLVRVEDLRADISVSFANTPPIAGREVTYRVSVFNDGPSEATDVTATTTLPAGVTLSATSTTQGTCAGTTIITCDLGRLTVYAPADMRITLSVYASTTGALELTTSATSTVTDRDPDNNSATIADEVIYLKAGAPTDLRAVGSGSQVELSWGTAEEGSAPITGWQYRYDAYVGPRHEGQSWTQDWTAVTSSVATTTSYTLAGLNNGTRYTFEVRAVDSLGIGGYASSANGTPGTELPPQPTSALEARARVTLSRGSPVSTVYEVTGGRIDIDWGDVDAAPNVVHYEIRYQSKDAVGGAWPNNESSTVLATVRESRYWRWDLDLTKLYRYQVRAVNSVGKGPWSASIPEDGIRPSIEAVEKVPVSDAGPFTLIEGGSAQSVQFAPNRYPGAVQVLSTGGADDDDRSVHYSHADVADTKRVLIELPFYEFEGGLVSAWNAGRSYWFVATDDYVAEVGESFTIRLLGAEPIDDVSLRVFARSDDITFNLTDRAPAAPVALGATPGNGRVTLSWQAAPEGVAITKWQYRKSNNSGASWSPDWTDVPGSVGSTETYTVTQLANGTHHTFEVRAVNDGGNGDASSVTGTPVAPPPPPPPVGGGGSGGGGSTGGGGGSVSNPPQRPAQPSVVGGDREIVVSWSEPTNQGPAINKYLVQYRALGATAWSAHTFQEIRTETTITELEPGTTYEVQVAARNSDGTGPWSSSGSGSTNPLVPPEAPAQPTVSSGDREITVNWSEPVNEGPEIAEYLVEYRVEGTSEWIVHPHEGTGTETTITELEPGTTYEVQVAAKNADGTGLWSDVGSGSTSPLITVVPEEEITPALIISPQTQVTMVVHPDRETVIEAAQDKATLTLPAASRNRTFQARLDTNMDSCADAGSSTASVEACVTVDIFDTEGTQESQVELDEPAELVMRLAPARVVELGGASVVIEVHNLGGLKVLTRPGPGDPWEELTFELREDVDGGASVIVSGLASFSDIALVLDNDTVEQARQQLGIPTPTPLPTATPEPTATPTPTATPEPTATPTPTATPESTATPLPTSTPAPTSTPKPPAKPQPATPTATATPGLAILVPTATSQPVIPGATREAAATEPTPPPAPSGGFCSSPQPGAPLTAGLGNLLLLMAPLALILGRRGLRTKRQRFSRSPSGQPVWRSRRST